MVFPTPICAAAPATLAGTAAGLLIAGAAMLLYGRKLHRVFLAAVGLCIGALLAGPIARQFDWPVLVTRAILGAVVAALAAVSARAVWVLLLASLALAVAGGVLLSAYGEQALDDAGPAPQLAPDAPSETVIQAYTDYSERLWRAFFQPRQTLIVLVLAGAATGGAVAGVLLPQFTVILLTALLGALCAVAGGLTALLAVRPAAWQATARTWLIPVSILAGLTVVSIVRQWRSAIREKKRKADEEAEGAEDGKAPAKAPAAEGKAEKKKA